MPLHFWHERGCVLVSFAGDYDAAEGLRMIDTALTVNSPAAGLLLDLSDSTSFRKRSSEDLRHIANFLFERRELFGSRVATVGRSDLSYGLLRMGTVFTAEHGIQAEAFRTREKALDWLCTLAGGQSATTESEPPHDVTNR